jgi:hypothetical protein
MGLPVREHHEMVLVGRVESGAEEWRCPACGRRELLRWPPNYERVVVDEGDATVTHFGTKGSVRVTAIAVRQETGNALGGAERQWLWDNGIDWDRTPA